MTNEAPKDLLNICRFCLSRDEENLIPMENVLLLTLTFQDILLFTGVQIEDDDKTLFAICVECTNKLKISTAFRNSCLKNDTAFRDLCSDLVAKTKAERVEAALALLAEAEAEEIVDGYRTPPTPHYDTIDLDSDDEFSYSANYTYGYLDACPICAL
uniref:ZAD domain-containing protein n=1 Tax=Anopheles epiroticus TaxID=199890 RepID=A0A182P536_9DIPT